MYGATSRFEPKLQIYRWVISTQYFINSYQSQREMSQSLWNHNYIITINYKRCSTHPFPPFHYHYIMLNHKFVLWVETKTSKHPNWLISSTVTCTLLQKGETSAGLHTQSSCLWDTTTDGMLKFIPLPSY